MCYERTCVIEDDFQAIVDTVRSSDDVVFATPVYYSDLSESMKVFTDRLRRCSAPFNARTGTNVNHLPAVGLCNAGGGGGGSEQCAVNLKKVLATCGFNVLDMVPVRRQNMDTKLGTLACLGGWFFDQIESGGWERP